jgi:hypothetical protein
MINIALLSNKKLVPILHPSNMSTYFKYSSSYQTSFHNLARFHICEDLLSINMTKRLKIFEHQTKLKHTNLMDLDLPGTTVNVEVVVDAPSPFVVEQVLAGRWPGRTPIG